jgi:hypothetical protein
MFLVHLSKAALAGLATVAMATTGAVAWTVAQQGDNPAKVTRTVDGSVDNLPALVPTDGLSDGSVAAGRDEVQGSGDANVSGSGLSGGASTKAGTPAGATAGATTSGSPSAPGSIGTSSGVSGVGASIVTGGPGAPISTGGSTGSQQPSGGSGGSGVTAPTVPSAPSGVSLHRQGSHTLVVPGTPSVNKKLCLSGEVNRCRNLSVPALQGATVTVKYSGNASASAPTFGTFPCEGGLGVTLTGITPGTSVTVEARGVTLTSTLGSREVSQSASFCDA